MTNPWSLSFLVGAGGFIGSIARYSLSLASQRLAIEWPAGTLSANVLGCLAIGLITGFTARSESMSPEVRLALATGFCGGFTTMSSMIYETAEMIRASEYLYAVLYAAGTFILSMAAFIAGVLLIHAIAKIGGVLWN